MISSSSTDPCDESPENTSEREEGNSTGDRFALVEEHPDGGAEERKVDTCKRKRKKKDGF